MWNSTVQWDIYMGQPQNIYLFFFKFWKFFKISDILIVLNFQQRVAKLGEFPINLMIFKAPPVQFWSSGYTWLTYFPPPSHCDSSVTPITNLEFRMFIQSYWLKKFSNIHNSGLEIRETIWWKLALKKVLILFQFVFEFLCCDRFLFYVILKSS